MSAWKIVLSCEHASNNIPTEYEHLFRQDKEILNSHEAYDLGALHASNTISHALKIRPILATSSRLLIDFNRSLTNPHCFSRYSNKLSLDQKQQLIEKFYLPYRQQVYTAIEKHIINKQRVLHLAIHSFTPILKDLRRNNDLGLLYDPKRLYEKPMAIFLKTEISKILPKLKIRYNYPYKGISDGLVTSLRKIFSEEYYCAFELEFNQNLFLQI